MNIKIARATINNLIELQVIGKTTFHETFAETNSESDLAKYLDESFDMNKLTTELNNSESFFFLAKLDEKVIGYLKLNIGSAQTESIIDNALEIERIYVLKEFHGKRVGSLLYNKAKEFALEKNLKQIWLGVWEHNQRAISFYKKQGFKEFSKHIFKLGDDEQTDIIMLLNI